MAFLDSIFFFLLILSILGSFCWYLIISYPKQIMAPGALCDITTPDANKYHNDCLHPCVRMLGDTTYIMVQSPYYGWNNKIENPILYLSDNYKTWNDGLLIQNTPISGNNSDPNVFVDDDGCIYVFWREHGTPLCNKCGCNYIIVGKFSVDGINFSETKIYLRNSWESGDTVQCPILIKHNEYFLFYAAWYQYEPNRKNLGISIWQGTNLKEPDFVLRETISFDSVYTCDKMFQFKLFGKLWFFPKILKHDLWHFDLFEYNEKLYMVSVAEKGDNIMLSVSEDYKHFKTLNIPLINSHFMENFVHYRQCYYKPSAFIKDNMLHLFYTANSKCNYNLNQLFVSKKNMQDIL